MFSYPPATWNTMGLGVACSWSTLGIVAILKPRMTAELFGITALTDSKIAGRESLVGFSGLIGSRDIAISFALFLLASKGQNDAMGTVILSTLCVSVADIYLVWTRRSYIEMTILTAGSCVWAFVGLGLCGVFD